MEETQNELSDQEIELFNIILDMLGTEEEGVFTVNDIAGKFNLGEVKDEQEKRKQEKSLQTWTGRTMKQFDLYGKKEGRIDKKRAYRFNRSHVEEIFRRYSLQFSGSGGQVVCDQENQASTNDHLKKIGGQQVVSSGNSNGLSGLSDQRGDQKPTYKPPETTYEKGRGQSRRCRK